MIDKVPAPPTDNLYKMLTIVGLVIWLVGWVGPVYGSVRLREEINKAHAATTEKSDAITERLLAAKQKEPQTEATKEAVAEYHRRLEWLNQTYTLQVAQMKNEQNALYFLFFFFNVIGFSGLWWGGRLWYYRLQQHLDAAAALEAERLRAEVKSRSANPSSVATNG